MLRKSVFSLVLLVALSVGPVAWAQGQGNGNDNGNGGGSNGNGNSSSDSPGNSGNGNGGGPPDHVGHESHGNGSGQARRQELSESDALAAVEAGKAVPLSTILPDVRSRTGGVVINVQMERANSRLLYAVRVLTPEGKVRVVYYNAASGEHMTN